jgi:aspartyl protease family protein
MMRHVVHRVLIVSLVACSIAAGPPAAAPPTAPSPAEEVLKSKGLTKVGTYWLLDADAKLPEGLKQMRQAQKALDDAVRKRKVLQAKLADAHAMIGRLEQESRRTDDQLANAKGLSTRDYNAVVARHNTINSQLRDGYAFVKARAKEIKELVPPNDDYITAVIALASRMEPANARYAELAKDPEVATAIDTLSAKPPRVRLGPSPQFASELKPVLKARDTVASAAIPLDTGGGVGHVDVSINGKAPVRMIVDSGASVISISSGTAKQLGIQATDKDPTATFELADGRKVKAKIVTLKTVRVAQFTATDVECSIVEDAGMSEGLLGGSFLQHFVYRIDLTAGVLHLSQISGQPSGAAAEKSAVAAKPAPASEPVVSPPTTTRASGAGDAPPTTKAGAREGEEILPTMTGDTGNKDADGAIVLHDGEQIRSALRYRPPVKFKVVAQTDGNDLRIGAMADQIIFNWRDNPGELRIDGGPAGGRHKPDAGKIPVNQWVEIEVEVAKNQMLISVDGQRRHRVQAGFAKSYRWLTVFPAVGSTIKVKSVRVIGGTENAAAN